jgi:HAD superfamily hydrolase (TIGR01450 family)
MPIDLSQFQAVLLDLDGTLCAEDKPLPGATELVRKLLAARQTIACLSNSTQSPQRIGRRLSENGMEFPADLIYTASASAVEYILETFRPRPRVFNLSTEGVQEMLEGKVVWVENEHQPCDAVIVGNPACHYCTIPRMQSGMRLLRSGAKCVGICEDRAYPAHDGLEIGSGATTHMLCFAGEVEPVFFGKPQKAFFLGLCKTLGVPPEKCVLVGDNLDSDIGGAKSVGMKTILSLTGVTRRGDLDSAPAEKRPDWVIDDLTALL